MVCRPALWALLIARGTRPLHLGSAATVPWARTGDAGDRQPNGPGEETKAAGQPYSGLGITDCTGQSADRLGAAKGIIIEVVNPDEYLDGRPVEPTWVVTFRRSTPCRGRPGTRLVGRQCLGGRAPISFEKQQGQPIEWNSTAMPPPRPGNLPLNATPLAVAGVARNGIFFLVSDGQTLLQLLHIEEVRRGYWRGSLRARPWSRLPGRRKNTPVSSC
jgi:hypothetical protein